MLGEREKRKKETALIAKYLKGEDEQNINGDERNSIEHKDGSEG